MADALRVALHGVHVALRTEREAFTRSAAAYLAPLLAEGGTEPQIRVTLAWDQPLPPANLELLGRRVAIGQNRLRLSEIRSLPGLQIEIEWDEDLMRVCASYTWPTRRSRWLARFSRQAQARLHVLLTYHLIYFPWGWWFERERGWSLLHAAAVARNQGGVMLTGLPGCGKSTFVWAALAMPEWRLLSDNLLFSEGAHLWSFPEPLHVDERSRQLAGSNPSGVQPTGRAFSHSREDFEPLPERRAGGAEPRAVVFLRRGQGRSIQRLDKETAFGRLWANDLLAFEWQAYQECAAAVHYLVPQVGNMDVRWTNLDTLVALPCYEISLAQGQTVHEAAREILTELIGA